MRKRKNTSSNSRRINREIKRIELKLKGYLNSFYSICYFDEKKLDWNIISEKEYQRLRGSWKAWCKSKGYPDEIITAFQWDCLLLKTDLIMQAKYEAGADKQELIKLLKKGMTPLEVADYAKKKLKLEKL